jgi:hypothetical protein
MGEVWRAGKKEEKRMGRGQTLILGYSTAGNSPSKVDLNKTIPEYSAWFACLELIVR